MAQVRGSAAAARRSRPSHRSRSTAETILLQRRHVSNVHLWCAALGHEFAERESFAEGLASPNSMPRLLRRKSLAYHHQCPRGSGCMTLTAVPRVLESM